MLHHCFRNGLQLTFRKDWTCRITRWWKNDGLCFWCDGRFKLLGSNLEIIFNTAWNNYRRCFCQPHKGIVAYPIWRKHHHLITRVQQGDHSVGNRLLGTIWYEYVLRFVGNIIFLLIFCRKCFAQILISWHRRVGKIFSIINSFLGCFTNMFGRFKIRFTQT